PERAAASAGSLPCKVQAHTPITVSAANPAATDTSPMRTKITRPPLSTRDAPPGASVPASLPHTIRQMRQSWRGGRIKKIFCEAYLQHFVNHCAHARFPGSVVGPEADRPLIHALRRGQRGQLRVLRVVISRGRNDADLFRFVDHRRLPPL